MSQIKTLEELDKIASNKNIEICYATVIDDDFSYYDKNRKYSAPSRGARAVPARPRSRP